VAFCDGLTRGLGIVGAAFVVALALAPRSADAQQISTCVNNSSGAVKFVAPNATCSNNETLVKVGGALGASAFSCEAAFLTSGGPLFGSGTGYIPGVSFGSGIGYVPNGTTFVLQPGIYELQLKVDIGQDLPASAIGTVLLVPVLVNNIQVDFFLGRASKDNNNGAVFPVFGTKLLQISTANTTVAFNVQFENTASMAGCGIIFTRLQ
jgi:hypothetical protein